MTKWKTARKGNFDGHPVNYVSSEEINARFAGGWKLFKFLTTWRFNEIKLHIARKKK